MGCGYGACKGCVIPVLTEMPAGLAPGDVVAPDDAAWRNATCCQEGPVFNAEQIDWRRLVRSERTGP